MMNFDLIVMTVLYWGRFLDRTAKRCRYTYAQYWGIPEKQANRGLRTYIFENPPGIFAFFTLPIEIPDKTRLQP